MAPATLRSQGLLDETLETSPPPATPTVSNDTATILAAIGLLTNEVKDLEVRVERLESKSPPSSPLVKPEDSAKKIGFVGSSGIGLEALEVRLMKSLMVAEY